MDIKFEEGASDVSTVLFYKSEEFTFLNLAKKGETIVQLKNERIAWS